MIFFIAPLALMLQTPTPPPVLPAPEKVVLTVNGHQILAKEVEAYLYEWNASQVGQALTTYLLVQEEATKRGVKVTDAEVDTEVKNQLQRMQAQAPKGTDVDAVLRQRGYPRSRIVLDIRMQMLLERIAGLDFKPAQFVKVSTLVIRPKSESALDVQAAVTAANAAYDALKKGGKWDDTVAKFSTDPQAAANHGKLGWIAIDQFPATAQTEIKTLPALGNTKPIQTPNGWQIFLVEMKGQDAAAADLAELKTRFTNPGAQQLIGRLQKEAKITTSY